MDSFPTLDDLKKVLRDIQDRASAALTHDDPRVYQTALHQIEQMAKYWFDPNPEHAKVRSYDESLSSDDK